MYTNRIIHQRKLVQQSAVIICIFSFREFYQGKNDGDFIHSEQFSHSVTDYAAFSLLPHRRGAIILCGWGIYSIVSSTCAALAAYLSSEYHRSSRSEHKKWISSKDYVISSLFFLTDIMSRIIQDTLCSRKRRKIRICLQKIKKHPQCRIRGVDITRNVIVLAVSQALQRLIKI